MPAFGRLHAADEIDDAAEMASWRLPGIWVQQLKLEREFIGFMAAFRGSVVFAVEKIESTKVEAPVIGFGDVLGHSALIRLILVVI
jgi:hypothetical protein